PRPRARHGVSRRGSRVARPHGPGDTEIEGGEPDRAVAGRGAPSMTSGSHWRYTDAYEYMRVVREGLPPAIICCACNGGLQGKEYNAAIPETPAEIADSVHEAYQAGASMVHIHARDPENLPGPARTAEQWREGTQRVRDPCPDIIINNTTGGGPGMTDAERLACLEAGPDVASLNLVPDMSRFSL